MGTPLPRNVLGNPCSVCWGVGKPFGEGETPKVLCMKLIGIKPGDDWDQDHEQLLLTPHFLEQIITPCDWDIDDGIFRWRWAFSATHTTGHVFRKSDSLTVFYQSYPPSCMTKLYNSYNDPWMVIAYDGFANITWNPEDLE